MLTRRRCTGTGRYVGVEVGLVREALAIQDPVLFRLNVLGRSFLYRVVPLLLLLSGESLAIYKSLVLFAEPGERWGGRRGGRISSRRKGREGDRG